MLWRIFNYNQFAFVTIIVYCKSMEQSKINLTQISNLFSKGQLRGTFKGLNQLYEDMRNQW